MNGLLGMLAMTASMLVVGWIVWKAITRHEESDADLQRRLDADDRRAADGRRLDAGMGPGGRESGAADDTADR